MTQPHARVANLHAQGWTDCHLLAEEEYLIALREASQSNGAVVEFEVYEIVGYDGEDGHTLFRNPDGTCVPADEPACPICIGDIKWDGCINLEFTNEPAVPHFCGRADLQRMTAMLLKLYDLAKPEAP